MSGPTAILIILDTVWHLLPFSMLIILAGLQGVPDEIIEAAKIDGATSLKSHLYVIIPTIRGVLVLRQPDLDHGCAAHVRSADPAGAAGGGDRQRVDHALHLHRRLRERAASSSGLGSAINVLTILLILIMLIPFIRETFREAKVAAR